MKKFILCIAFFCVSLVLPIKAEVIIDVRTIEEYTSGHIENTLHIEWQAIDEINQSIPKDEKIYLYCRSGNRSGKAQKILLNLGYKDVINLGGINTAAKTLGLNIVK